ncbi:16S rRNA methyltransferase [Pontibacillus halophilus JSM 076056 = DSM 19796]|uniref:16S rRNA (cytosine(967)-C(5))-methyltransferase n=1 Tax=Pontibacillus halophilus JSM 076056 = DSM 19796 TaxID=1385510 RepID=A0A0A5GPN8_9BACI|nr:16S rRNA (cytosine(967)-C(5))-methyltransferase RsmB [Pontibacillus halophilus]KGX93218.1 16S rRNA methyltransferase [Pontibacillus halophilus JSM 076056 = DSM 19796]
MSNEALRETALEILTRVGENNSFSHLLMNQAIEKKGLAHRDTGLLTEIVYGTLQRKVGLQYLVAPFIVKQKKLKPWVLWLLYMSVYQMKYLDRVPDHAVIHEAVEIAKKKGHKGIASMVNGVLRSMQRNGTRSFEEIEDPIERLATETSHPLWMVKRWVDMYGLEETKAMCFTNLETKSMSVRVNTTKYTRSEIIERLTEDEFDVEPSSLANDGILIFKGNILKHELFRNGGLTIQDESSMLVGQHIGVSKGMEVLDACSAPGGKTTHMAEYMDNEGNVTAYDLHEKKVRLVKQKAEQLGLTNVTTGAADSRALRDKHDDHTFDRILLDAPCSGLGVVRGKPDIKYSKSEEDIKTLSRIQRELLESVSPLLKEDGKLMYSTCTVDVQENEQVIQSFLQDHPEWEVDAAFFEELPEETKELPGVSPFGLQLFPQDFDTDGFFLTRLKRRSDFHDGSNEAREHTSNETTKA